MSDPAEIRKHPDPLLEVSIVASRMKVSAETVRSYIRDGYLHALRLPGRIYRIRESALKEFLASLEQ